MAGTIAATGVEQLQGQRKGMMAISLTDFDLITVSQIAEGSGLEIAGSWVDFLADESMGAGWAGMGIGDVYARIDSVALTSEYTATAPVWNTELQGYYDATGQYKYYAKLYKDAGSNYTLKALYTNIRGVMIANDGIALNTGANADQTIRLANDCRLLWDESVSRIYIDNTLSITSGNLHIPTGSFIGGNLGADISFQGGYGLNGVKKEQSYISGSVTENAIFDDLKAYIPIGTHKNVFGGIVVGGALCAISKIYRGNATEMIISYISAAGVGSLTITDGNATSHTVLISI